jgi:hypothetical protein
MEYFSTSKIDNYHLKPVTRQEDRQHAREVQCLLIAREE